jgi:hypothetical protein
MYREADGLPPGSVQALCEDRQGRLWVGLGSPEEPLLRGFGPLSGGLACYDGRSWRMYREADGLPPGSVHALCEDWQGRLWVGLGYRNPHLRRTFGFLSGGLACYDGRNWRLYREADGLLPGSVHALCEDRQGRLWVGLFGREDSLRSVSPLSISGSGGVMLANLETNLVYFRLSSSDGLACYDGRSREMFSILWWNPAREIRWSLPASLPEALIQSKIFHECALDIAEWEGVRGQLRSVSSVEEIGALHEDLTRLSNVVEARNRSGRISLLTFDVLRQLVAMQHVVTLLWTKFQKATNIDDQVYFLDDAVGILQANREIISRWFSDARERDYFHSVNDHWLTLAPNGNAA